MRELKDMEMNRIVGGDQGPQYIGGQMSEAEAKEMARIADLMATLKSRNAERYGDGLACEGWTFEGSKDVEIKGPKIG